MEMGVVMEMIERHWAAAAAAIAAVGPLLEHDPQLAQDTV